jgi:hypothetical protein
MSKLFRESRVCVSCRGEATPRVRVHGEPNIVSISFVIYYRGAGKRLLKAAPRIQICSECLAKALAEPKLWQGSEGRKFNAAIRESLSARYSEILNEDSATAIRPAAPQGGPELFEGRA